MGEVIDLRKFLAEQERRRNLEGAAIPKRLTTLFSNGPEFHYSSGFCETCERAKGFDGKCHNKNCPDS